MMTMDIVQRYQDAHIMTCSNLLLLTKQLAIATHMLSFPLL